MVKGPGWSRALDGQGPGCQGPATSRRRAYSRTASMVRLAWRRLGAEAVVRAAEAGAGPFHQIGDGGRGVALLGEDRRGRVEQDPPRPRGTPPLPGLCARLCWRLCSRLCLRGRLLAHLVLTDPRAGALTHTGIMA